MRGEPRSLLPKSPDISTDTSTAWDKLTGSIMSHPASVKKATGSALHLAFKNDVLEQIKQKHTHANHAYPIKRADR